MALYPEPLFVLSTGHAFSSVVSAMLGRHPDTFDVPELNLFLADTLADCVKTFMITGRQPLPGLKRVLAQLHDGKQTVESVERATSWIEKHGSYSARQVMDHLQECVGDKIIVEKSPSTAFMPRSVLRLANQFPAAPLVHLVRHPRSFGTSRHADLKGRPKVRMLQRLMGNDDLAEQWRTNNLRIHAYGQCLAAGQMLRIRGEDFLKAPRLYLPQFCDWLGLSGSPEAVERMMHPEDSPFAHFGPENAKAGTSPKFLANPALDEDRLARMSTPSLEGPVDWQDGRPFTPELKELAGWLGYA